MNTEIKEVKGKNHRILGWILTIIGGLFTLAGIFLLIVFSTTQSDISRFLFTALFLAVGLILLIYGIRLINHKEIKKNIVLFSAGGVLVLAAIFCVSVVSSGKPKESSTQNIADSTTSILQPTYTQLPTYTAYPTNTSLPTNIPGPTYTLGPTNTPEPTYTPSPTYTPLPTNTPVPTNTSSPTAFPNLITCDEIVAKHDSATDIQWQDYKDKVRGMNYHFSGEVRQVYDNNSVSISSDDARCGTTVYSVPRDIAIGLSKGQHIEGYGTIKDLSWFLWVATVDVYLLPETIIVH